MPRSAPGEDGGVHDPYESSDRQTAASDERNEHRGVQWEQSRRLTDARLELTAAPSIATLLAAILEEIEVGKTKTVGV